MPRTCPPPPLGRAGCARWLRQQPASCCPRVYAARLICSDEVYADQARGEAQILKELDTLVCDCGCALAVRARSP
jgi:hypothetical protein